MVSDAEAHKAEDEKRKELVEAENRADALVHQTRKTLKELGDKVDNSLKSKIEKVVMS